MQLTEAEIEQILNDYWPGRDDDTDRSEAAHAIAEKLKEGVVWQGEAEIRHLHCPRDREHTYLHYPHIDDPAYTECFSESYVLKHGQLVTVTVSKKEERDG